MQYPSFQNSLKNIFSIRLKRSWKLVLEENFKKNKNGKKEITAKKRLKLPRFQTLTNCFDRYMVIVRIWSSVGQAM